MSDAIITVEGLGKRYRIHHQHEHERYVALRDVIARKAAALVQWLRGHPAPTTRAVEDFWALRDVSFEIQRGEVVGIIGGNGAGKSTLLKVLSRITEPTEGRITIDGDVASLLEVGTGFHPELSGRENIFLNAAILGMTRQETARKFDEIVAFAEVERFLDTPVKRYSSGMYVRLAFAVAAHLEPEILIVDEVLAVGDAEFQKRCLGKMHDVSRDGRTVLFVSHNMAAIQELCSRVVYLQDGRVVGDGAADKLISQYLASSQRAAVPRLHTPVSIGHAIELQAFEMAPSVVASGDRVTFTITLYAHVAARVGELAILIYSSHETRVAIVDLRACGLPVSLAPGQTWTLSGWIKSLPLVEGGYRIGLYAGAGEFLGNLFDLIELSVVRRPSANGFAPYPAVHRGVVELQYGVDEIAS